ncbi:MAG: glycosyltransferase family 2 protein [Lachnospiraceae bacterium]|nr:glycosyltransferase family 2 protein [Lachnospiraceae bacterium]
MSKPLISIIIPVYNTRDCLEKCVDSCLAQTWPQLEILLVDDGSTDGTDQLCDRLAEKDERIRVFHKKNGGSSSARNLGIREARGEYLGFVDSDDFISPGMYERLMEAIREKNVEVAQISRDEIDASGNRLPDVCTPPKEAFFCESESFFQELLLHRGDCSFCTKLLHRRLLENRNFPEGKLNEDFYLLLQLLPEIKGIYILPKQEYHVFYRIGSNTRKKDKNDFSRVFMDIVDNADVAMELVEKHYPSLRQVCIRFGLYQRLDYLLHIPIPQMNGKNEFYVRVKRWLQRHVGDILNNPYLTKKERIYLLLLTPAPRTVRWVHSLKMR